MPINPNILLNSILVLQNEAEISVEGVSMEPVLYKGDMLHIKKGSYSLGDILVFPYKNGELLVHRYIGERLGRLLCKGDNSFRIEDIAAKDVIGKVVGLTNNGVTYKIPAPPQALIDASYQVGKMFRQNGYNIELTKKTSLYQHFIRMEAEYAAFREPTNKE